MKLLQLLTQFFTEKKDSKAYDNSFPLKIAPTASCSLELISILANNDLINIHNRICNYEYRCNSKRKLCSEKLILKQDPTNMLDGYCLVCPIHTGYQSIRTGSWFADRRLPLAVLVHIFYLLSNGNSINQVVKYYKPIKLNRKTVSAILTDLQERMWVKLCKDHMPTFSPRDHCEIDEMWCSWSKWKCRIGPPITEEHIKKDGNSGRMVNG